MVILSSDRSGGAVLQAGPRSNAPWRGNLLNTPFEGSIEGAGDKGAVPAGAVANETLAAGDRVTTLAGTVGASKFVP